MRRTWIHFTDRLYDLIRDEARRRDVSVSHVCREMAETRYGVEPEVIRHGQRTDLNRTSTQSQPTNT